MHARLLSFGLLLAAVPVAPAGSMATLEPPVLPEVRQHLDDGWACIHSDPDMARAHAMAVLVGDDVTVRITLDKVPGSRKTACKAAVDEALETWAKAVPNLKLRRVEMGDSGIQIRFQPDVRDKGEPVAGYVNWKRKAADGSGSVTGDVQIRSVNIDGEPMSMRAMRHIVLHEMGHLLGLDDSNRTGEAMGPLDVNKPVSAPTDAEAAAVRRLRTEAEKLLQDAK